MRNVIIVILLLIIVALTFSKLVTPVQRAIQHIFHSHSVFVEHDVGMVVAKTDAERVITEEDADRVITEEDVELLALNIYFHNGGTNTEMSKKAITAVVFNRVDDRDHHWPRTIRGVIRGGKERGRNCDFSFECDTYSDVPKDIKRFRADRALVERWVTEYCAQVFEDPTHGATWFINKRIQPPRSWPMLVRTKTYGQYSFYRYPH